MDNKRIVNMLKGVAKMTSEKVLVLIGFFFVNGLLVGSLFTGREYIIEILLFTVAANLVYVGLLTYLKKSPKGIS